MSRASILLLALALALGCSGEASRPARLDEAAPARDLVVRWVGAADSDAPLLVLMHGYGAPADDLVPLGRSLHRALGAELRVALPEAPLARPPSGRAWWLLDRGAARPADRGVDRPSGLAAARRDVVSWLEGERRRGRLVPGRTVLAGFSQGAMLALDVGLEWEREVAGIAALSGGPLDEARWTARMQARPPRRVFLSHGRADPLLRFDAAERLRGSLERAGAPVTFVPFDGGHAIPPEVQRALVSTLRSWLE